MKNLNARNLIRLIIVCVVCVLVICFTACAPDCSYYGSHYRERVEEERVWKDQLYNHDYWENYYDEIEHENKKWLKKEYSIDGYNLFFDSGYINDELNNCEKNPNSYFSLDSPNTTSYNELREEINDFDTINSHPFKIIGYSFQTNEFINYFNNSYQKPEGNDKFSITSEIGAAPWNPDNKLLTVAINAKEIEISKTIGNNYVFVINRSRYSYNKMLEKALLSLLNQLNENDVISIITFDDSIEEKINVLVDGEKANSNLLKEKIKSLDSNFNECDDADNCINKAYEIAEKHFTSVGNNKVILLTSDLIRMQYTYRMIETIRNKKDYSIYLSCFDFSSYYFNDVLINLTKEGNGIYSYIENESEIQNKFIDEIKKNYSIIAKDVDTWIEFNPNAVENYRLIGYEDSDIVRGDYYEGYKRTKEVKSGQSIVVCYELILKDNIEEEIANVHIKYRRPYFSSLLEENQSISLNNDFNNTDNFKFISNLIWFSLITKSSPYVIDYNYSNLIANLDSIQSIQEDELKQEFVGLVKKAYDNNLIDFEDYEKSKLIIMHAYYGIKYFLVEENSFIDKDSLIEILRIRIYSDFLKFYIDSDYKNYFSSFTLKEDTHIYLVIEKQTEELIV